MKRIKAAVLSLCLGLLSVPFAQNLGADEWDQKTLVTFNEPVEVPGKVLPAGTYVFKLADSPSDRNIVQIFSADEKHIYASILAISDEHLQPTGKTVITFEERAKGTPEAIKAWFYPGNNIGERFVYHKIRAVELAKNSNQNVPAMTSQAAASQPVSPVAATPTPASSEDNNSQIAVLKQEPVKAVTPLGAEVEVDEILMAQADVLPKTASHLPLLILLGLTSLIGILPVRHALNKLS